MPTSFNLVAALQLQTTGLSDVSRQIERGLSNLNATVGIKVHPRAIADLQAQLSNVKADVNVNFKVTGLPAFIAQVDQASNAVGQLAARLGNTTTSLGNQIAGLVSTLRTVTQATNAAAKAAGNAPVSRSAPAAAEYDVSARSLIDGLRQKVRDAYYVDKVKRFVGVGSDDAQGAVASGSTTSYRRSNAIIAGAEGAIVGFASGGGPVAGLIGGAVGVAAALNKAAEDIAEVKLGKELSVLADRLARVNEFGDAASLSLAGSSAAASTNRAFQKRNVAYEDDAMFRNLAEGFRYVSFQSTGQERIQEFEKAATEEVFEKARQGVLERLQKQAAGLGLNNPNSSANDLLSRFGKDRNNLPFLQLQSVGEGRSIGELLSDYRQNVLAGQRQGAGIIDKTRVEAANDGLKRMVDNLGSAVDSLRGLNDRSNQLASLFEGRLTGSVVRLEQVRGNGISPVAGLGGTPFAAQGQELKQALDVLPGVFRELAKANISDPSAYRLGLSQNLEGAGISKEIRESVFAAVNERLARPGGAASLNAEGSINARGLTEDILGSRLKAYQATTKEITSQLESNANAFLSRLSQFQGLRSQLGTGRDVLSDLQLQGLLSQAQITADKTGRRHSVDDLVSVDELTKPFRDRLQRLTGLGANAQDPAAIGKALSQTQDRIAKLTEQQSAQFKATGGKGPDFVATATELSRLTGQAANLQAALKSLTETTLSAQKAKLSELDKQRDSKLGFGLQFLGADFQGRNQINRGLLLSQVAQRTGNIDNFTPENARLVIDTLRSLGEARLPGLKNENPRDLLERLASNAFGGAFGETRDEKTERDSLQKQILAGEKARQDAQQQLIANQERLAGSFFDNLNKAHADFYAKLGDIMKGAPVAQGKAAGGSIFQTKGTDTVPAMLTPGEFVVNAAAAKKHAGLLKKINSGAAYLAGGGFPLFPRPADPYAPAGFPLFPRPDDPYAVHPLEQGLRAFKEFKDRQREQLPVADHERVRQAIQEAKQRIGDQSQTYGTPDGPDAPDQFAQTIGTPQGPDAPAPGGGGGRVMVIPATAPRPRPQQAQRGVAAPLSAEEGVIGDFRQEVQTNPLGVSGYVASGYSPLFRQQQYVANLARRQRYAQTGDTIGMQDAVNSFGRIREKQLANRKLAQAFAQARIKAGVKPGAFLEDALRPSPFTHDQEIFRPGGALRWRRFAAGGLVPGAGTSDTVPSLLTPGEFVLNRGATKALGLANGGSVPGQSGAPGGAGLDFSGFQAGATAFGNSVSTFTQSLTAFNGNASALADAIGKMPRTLSVQHAEQKVVVTHNGAEMFSRMEPEIKRLITEQTKDAMRTVFKDQLPDAGVTV